MKDCIALTRAKPLRGVAKADTTTNSQYNLLEIGTKIADQAHRDGVAERFADPAVPTNIEVDLALITGERVAGGEKRCQRGRGHASPPQAVLAA